MNLSQIASGIRLILSDVDGVLTDGGLYFDSQGVEAKRFHIRDGMGIKLWRRVGFQFGLVTARKSPMVEKRAGELKLDLVIQGREDKWTAVQEVMAERTLTPEQICFIGDDLTDLPVIRRVGLGVGVADAAAEVRNHAGLVTQLPGGRGAVRELIERLLKMKNLWEEAIRSYTMD